ncbi:hypothetical protein PIB30_071692 [Stylosanthes scabra]|uniref:Uncharacterized protein n=1 Tax=Stylosanthes scabra TaxID=79078 RepID=A0ABU6SP12_9FABA|nr:hypothetical protein [Stylosanthes scabra]
MAPDIEARSANKGSSKPGDFAKGYLSSFQYIVGIGSEYILRMFWGSLKELTNSIALMLSVMGSVFVKRTRGRMGVVNWSGTDFSITEINSTLDHGSNSRLCLEFLFICWYFICGNERMENDQRG